MTKIHVDDGWKRPSMRRYAEAVVVWRRAISLDDRNDPGLRRGLENSLKALGE
jgi:hypothetical protein